MIWNEKGNERSKMFAFDLDHFSSNNKQQRMIKALSGELTHELNRCIIVKRKGMRSSCL